jgi:hypothetical protein
VTQGLSAARLERMHTVLGGYIDRGENAGLVALVSRREAVHVEALHPSHSTDDGIPRAAARLDRLLDPRIPGDRGIRSTRQRRRRPS